MYPRECVSASALYICFCHIHPTRDDEHVHVCHAPAILSRMVEVLQNWRSEIIQRPQVSAHPPSPLQLLVYWTTRSGLHKCLLLTVHPHTEVSPRGHAANRFLCRLPEEITCSVVLYTAAYSLRGQTFRERELSRTSGPRETTVVATCSSMNISPRIFT